MSLNIGRPAKVFNLDIESGSFQTYINFEIYGILVNLVKKDLTEKPLKNAPEDQSLSIFWKRAKAFKYVHSPSFFGEWRSQSI